MKIIELLNKIANGEEAPKKIKFKGEIFILNNCNTSESESNFDYLCYNFSDLNEEVEIIEDEIDIQGIEELGRYCDLIGLTENGEILWKMIQNNANKINELIRAVKQIDKK